MSEASQKSAIGRYWHDFGGMGALVRSPYVWCSGIATIALTPEWLSEGWWTNVYSIVPSLLGFTLGAYAMLVAFGNDRFTRLITTRLSGGTGLSAYESTSAAFVHFIVVQMLALFLAYLCDAWYFVPSASLGTIVAVLPDWVVNPVTCLTWLLSFWCFAYSIACGLAATLRVFTLSKWFATLSQKDSGSDKK